MESKNRSNVLLVEILIAVFFFLLSASVIVRVFAAAREMTVRSSACAHALAEAQNVAEALYETDDPDALLETLDFAQSHGVWTRDDGEYSLFVRMSAGQTDAGELWQAEIQAFRISRSAANDRPASEALFSLPCTRYKEAET